MAAICANSGHSATAWRSGKIDPIAALWFGKPSVSSYPFALAGRLRRERPAVAPNTLAEAARPGTNLQAPAGSQRHFILVRVLQWAQPQPRGALSSGQCRTNNRGQNRRETYD